VQVEEFVEFGVEGAEEDYMWHFGGLMGMSLEERTRRGFEWNMGLKGRSARID